MQATSQFEIGSTHPDFSRLGTFSLWFGVALVGLTAIHGVPAQPELVQCLWGFLHIMRAVFAALLLASILNLGRARREARPVGLPQTVAPVVINLFTLCIIFLVPFGSLWQSAHFSLNRAGYEQVAGRALRGELVVAETGWADLPDGYGHLAATGAVFVQADGAALTLYFPQVSPSSKETGILYRSDGRWPYLDGLHVTWQQLRQLAPYWYAGAGGPA